MARAKTFTPSVLMALFRQYVTLTAEDIQNLVDLSPSSVPVYVSWVRKEFGVKIKGKKGVYTLQTAGKKAYALPPVSPVLREYLLAA